jgi:hypothetical protein
VDCHCRAADVSLDGYELALARPERVRRLLVWLLTREALLTYEERNLLIACERAVLRVESQWVDPEVATR